jgi:hypothetical protein
MNRNERMITLCLLREARAAGWKLAGLFDGDEHNEGISEADALDLANNLDECTWMFELPKDKALDGKSHSGNVQMIFGNGDDGLTVISDHHMTLGKFLDFDTHRPEAERIQSPHGCGFMERVDAYRDELERYAQGQDACYKETSRRYLERDRMEFAAGELAHHLQELVKWYGKRTGANAGIGDELLPPEQQELEIAAAMRLLAQVRGE